MEHHKCCFCPLRLPRPLHIVQSGSLPESPIHFTALAQNPASCFLHTDGPPTDHTPPATSLRQATPGPLFFAPGWDTTPVSPMKIAPPSHHESDADRLTQQMKAPPAPQSPVLMPDNRASSSASGHVRAPAGRGVLGCACAAAAQGSTHCAEPLRPLGRMMEGLTLLGRTLHGWHNHMV